MSHLFLEFPALKPGVPDVQALMNVIRSETRTAFVISADVVKFVRDALIVNTTITSFKNCYFAFNEGREFIEFDSNGTSRCFTETPDWFISPGEFSRSQWLINHQLAEVSTPAFIEVLMSWPLKERREHCDLLFDLGLNKSASTPGTTFASKSGNKNRITTKPKIHDIASVEIFQQFFLRLKTAVAENRFPTLQILTDCEDVSRVPVTLKGAVRTWFKSITNELPPNNKRVAAGNAALFCAPVREQIQQIESWGVERYYQALSRAIAEAGDRYIADFSFHYRE
ncbi:hypothetical protein [Phytobacter sp. V91]|uniref:hypothetical protein n=1 Tax=Phytobacter sp. V91 TaxID=3369425 RepID=UPI003F60BB82